MDKKFIIDLVDEMISNTKYYMKKNVGNVLYYDKHELEDEVFKQLAHEITTKVKKNNSWQVNIDDDAIIFSSKKVTDENFNETITYSLSDILFEMGAYE